MALTIGPTKVEIERSALYHTIFDQNDAKKITFFPVSLVLRAANLLLVREVNAVTYTLYTNRADRRAALGGTPGTENFNSFTLDTLFGGSSISAGALRLSSNANLSEAPIDVPRYRSGATGIDGTTASLNANGFTYNTFDNLSWGSILTPTSTSTHEPAMPFGLVSLGLTAIGSRYGNKPR